MNSLLSVIGILALVYIGYGLLLFVNQRGILYYPTPVVSHPFEDEIFENDDESIRVVVANKGKDRAVMYFGGNGEAVAYGAPQMANALRETTLYFVNYRGYGGSTGSPTEEGIYSDAFHVFDNISSRHSEVAVIGRSLGSGVATMLVSKRPVSRLVLITPFDSVVSVAQGAFPFYPAAFIVLDKYDSIARADAIQVETLVLVAENDRVIPRKNTDNLIRALAPALLQTELLVGTDHNSVSLHRKYYRYISDFLEQ